MSQRRFKNHTRPRVTVSRAGAEPWALAALHDDDGHLPWEGWDCFGVLWTTAPSGEMGQQALIGAVERPSTPLRKIFC